MALISAKFPMIYKRKESTGSVKFGAPKAVGKAIQLGDTPTVSRAVLYADDIEAESDGRVASRALTLGTSTIPTACAADMFGITVTAADTSGDKPETVTYTDEADGEYLGLSIIRGEVVDGVKRFIVCFYPKVKFDQPAETYATKGETLTFATHSIPGKAVADPLMLDSKGRAVEKIEYIFTSAAAAAAYQLTLGDLVTTDSNTQEGAN